MLDPSTYRIPPDSDLDLDAHEADAKTGFEGGKKDGKAALPALTKRLSELQRLLWADSSHSLLVVLQATDTGGKDGTIRHVFKGVNPQGVHVRGFNKPSSWELAHDYLWRVHRHTPEDGAITIFNRSHYEDVLVVRVKGLVPEEQLAKRYRHIREFERMLVDEGTTIVKLFLNISKDEQKERLRARLDEPDKNWKFNKADLADRELWDQFREAYGVAIRETSTDYAPWYVVPADRKWYRNLVVSSILIRTLEEMDLEYPEAEDDLEGAVIE
ncbi:MAG TPA: polyphosphate kinase 2 family protein [Acidimicrobiia bacterium]|nr:polyphosphate kinase 2 family protein [Acidimicrobiia bacterium]